MIKAKAMVSSLIPNTLPNRLNSNIIKMMTMLFTPTLCINLLRSRHLVNFKNDRMPISMALLLFIIQNAPPMINMNTMMLLCLTKPL